MNEQRFDKKIKDLSRDAASQNPMPFDEKAWGKMEQLLDGKKDKRRFIAWWWLLPLLMAISGTAFFLYHHSPHDKTIAAAPKTNEPNIRTQPVAIDSKALQPKSAPMLEGRISKGKNIGQRIQGDKKEVALDAKPLVSTKNNLPIAFKNELPNQTGISSKTNAHTNGKSKNKAISLVIDKLSSKNDKALHNGKTNSLINSGGNQINNGVLGVDGKSKSSVRAVGKTNTFVDDGVKIPAPAVDTTSEIHVGVEKTNVEITILDSTQTSPNAKNATTTDSASKKATVAKVKSKKSSLSKFELGVLTTADYSTVKFKQADKISYGFGIGATYHFSKKLSLNTGFTVSRKWYSADSTDYKNLAVLWPWWRVKAIAANCLVYEVPVNIQYQFSASGKNSWYALAGLSSYFMKTETYDYDYLYNGQPKKTSITYKDQNNHLFSVLSLGVAYRKQFSKQFAYQVAPFVKVPLTGIGAGSVGLYSAGLQLSVHFRGSKK